MSDKISVLEITEILKSSDISEQYDLSIDTSSAGEGMSDVVASLKLKNTAGVVTVKGTVTGVCALSCDRCLDDVSMKLTAKLDTIVSFDGSKDDSVVVENGRIDLAKTAFDALSLEIPLIVLCKEDCKGLCQYCGTNLNKGECNCKEE